MEKYYQKTMVNAALQCHDNIQKLAQQRGRSSHKEDIKILKEWPLQTEAETTSLILCRLISRKYSTDKTAQQIQDRYKYLCKKHSYTSIKLSM